MKEIRRVLLSSFNMNEWKSRGNFVIGPPITWGAEVPRLRRSTSLMLPSWYESVTKWITGALGRHRKMLKANSPNVSGRWTRDCAFPSITVISLFGNLMSLWNKCLCYMLIYPPWNLIGSALESALELENVCIGECYWFACARTLEMRCSRQKCSTRRVSS